MWIMYKLGFLHCDISINNIMLKRLPKDAAFDDFLGILIDFDLSINERSTLATLPSVCFPYVVILLSHDNTDALLKGTRPFMAIDVLQGGSGFRHKYQYDLESLLYTAIFMCMTQAGPYGLCRDWADGEYAMSQIAIWEGNNRVYSSDEFIALAKERVMSDKSRFDSDIVEEIHPYFKPLSSCLERLRSTLFSPFAGVDKLVEVLVAARDKARELKDEKKANICESLLPVSERTPDSVFGSFVTILKETYEDLVKEHSQQPKSSQSEVEAVGKRKREEEDPDSQSPKRVKLVAHSEDVLCDTGN